MELKKKDVELLLLLQENSKKSNREIAKELKISKETVALKISNYFHNNLIKSYYLKVNYDKLGFKEINLFIRFKKISNIIITEFIKYLEKQDNTTWIGKSFGKYDLKVAFIFKDISQVNEFIFEISSKFGKDIEIIDSLHIIEKYKSSLNLFFNDNNNLKYKKILNKKTSNLKDEINLDNFDKSLLYLLGENPKISYVELGNKLNYTPEGVKFRIKKLETLNIILGNSIVINGNKLNKIWCLVMIQINPEKNLEFKNKIKLNPNLTSYVETLGIWNFNLTLFASNISELYENINKIRSDFSEDIRNLEFLIFFDFYKFPKIPKCILN